MEKRGSRGLVILIFLSISSGFFVSNTCYAYSESMMYVGGTGAGNYTSIQDALDNVTAGGTVYVYAGTYFERLSITTPVVLIGAQKDGTIIDGGNEGFVVTLAAGNSTLSGFSITHSGRMFPLAGVYVCSDSNTISGNILTDNYYGLVLESAQGNEISYNEIVHNLRCGVYFSRASNNTLEGNIVSHHSFNGFGLYEFSNNNMIRENVLMNNNFSGVNVRDSYDNHVIDNRFIGDQVGLHVPLPGQNTVVQGNVFSENRIDREEEREPLMTIGAGYAVFLLLVYYMIRKWKT